MSGLALTVLFASMFGLGVVLMFLVIGFLLSMTRRESDAPAEPEQ